MKDFCIIQYLKVKTINQIWYCYISRAMCNIQLFVVIDVEYLFYRDKNDATNG